MPLLTLTTDFGLDDAYVAAMKGAILTIAPDCRLVDISHGIAAQDVMGAGFVLRGAVPYFPRGTVHLAVVDPGVGTDRRPIAARIGGHLFVGPDNGLISLLLDGLDLFAPAETVVLDRPAFWRTPSPSATFHGRDIFAPVAAHLALGRTLNDVGTPTDDLQRLHWVQPLADTQGVRGWIVHVDRFGNAVTNIPGALLAEHAAGRETKCYVGSAILDRVHQTYGDVDDGEPVVLVGSSGLVEIGINGGNASELLSLHKGGSVNVVFTDRD